MPFTVVEHPRGRFYRLRMWYSQAALPHRCTECRRITTGEIEGISRVRFHLCRTCLGKMFPL